jgi:hypothetical protein
MHNLSANTVQEGVHSIHVLATACTETDVMETDPPLNEPLLAIFLVAPHHAQARPRTDAVDQSIATIDEFHFKQLEELLIKRRASFEVTHRDLNVRNTIDVHFGLRECKKVSL